MADVTVKGTTKKAPSGAYFYWTQFGHENINLADKKVQLPPGTYDLYWDFRGKGGDSLQVNITDDKGRELTTLNDTISPHDSESWGQKLFKVLP